MTAGVSRVEARAPGGAQPGGAELDGRFRLGRTRGPLPVLIGCSHGTADPEGRAAIRALLQQVRRTAATLGCAEIDVVESFVDVQHPQIGEVVASVLHTAAAGAVVVPLLLSGGFHVHVDIAAAVGGTGMRAVASRPLGPDPRLVQILLERIKEAGVDEARAVVIAAAGSSDPRAGRDVEAVAAALAQQRSGPVSVGYGAMASPTVDEAVDAAGPLAAAASYLLAPGHFHGRVRAAGAAVVTRPLAPHPLLAEIVLDRYAAAVLRGRRS